jgi:hypothetical protein
MSEFGKPPPPDTSKLSASLKVIKDLPQASKAAALLGLLNHVLTQTGVRSTTNKEIAAREIGAPPPPRLTETPPPITDRADKARQILRRTPYPS